MPVRFSLITLARQEIRPLALLFGAAVLLLVLGHLAMAVLEGDTAGFDRAILLAMRTDADPAIPVGPPLLTEIARDITSLGSYAVLTFVSLAVLGYLILIRKGYAATFVLITLVGGVVLNTVLKQAIDRPRPDLVPHAARVFTASFPSAHATLSAVVFLTFGTLLARAHAERRLKVYFLALAIIVTLSVGTSRVYLGVHYPTDVIAGWAVGSAWAILCWVLAAWFQQRAGGRSVPTEPGPAAGNDR